MRKQFKNKPRFFRPETEDRRCFPEIETKRPEIAVYPPISKSDSRSFIYINNFGERDYQFEISLSCVKKNSLIIIPTGLGKTFIAAMIIINFYRWFPTGKIIFMATSRPLVKQQMFSIRKMDIIPKKDIVEITGGILQTTRNQYWENARLFFATPQTVQKDIERGVCPISQVVLIVVDEAHHARGNHSYCRIIQSVAAVTKFFRVIALSATPGSSFDDIQQIIYNLMISNIQIRTEQDCSKYTHNKDIKYVVVPNAQGVEELSARLNSIIQEYLRILLQESLVSTMDPTRTSKGTIAQLLKRSRDSSPAANCAIVQSLKLLNLREKLENYSIAVFTRELEEMLLKRDNKITNDETVTTTYEELHNLLQVARRNPQEDPKMKKLSELVIDFFNSSSSASKIIIFCSYRDIVHDIVNYLKQSSPSIKAVEFIGQASSDKSHGLNQSKQLRVMDAFKKGIFNVLVSTSIGEEGLDIGEVDLIIFYDIQKSTTRTIQRMGRTGRHQDGSVIILLSEASKHLANKAENASDSTANLISRRMDDFVFYTDCPPMNENDLIIYRKQYDVREIEAYELKEKKEKDTKRATLLTTELEELHDHHGKHFKYDPLKLDKYADYQGSTAPFTSIGPSFEAKILQSVIDSILLSSVTNSLAPDTSLNLSPFALDSSQVQYERPEYLNHSPCLHFTPKSSQTPHRMGMREFLGIDMSSDTSDTESSNSLQIKINELKNKSKLADDDSSKKNKEIKLLKKNATRIRNDALMQLCTEDNKISSFAESDEEDSAIRTLYSSEKQPSQQNSGIITQLKPALTQLLNEIGSLTSSDRSSSPNKNSEKHRKKQIDDSDTPDNNFSEETVIRPSSISKFHQSESSDSDENEINLEKRQNNISRVYKSESSDSDNQKNQSSNPITDDSIQFISSSRANTVITHSQSSDSDNQKNNSNLYSDNSIQFISSYKPKDKISESCDSRSRTDSFSDDDSTKNQQKENLGKNLDSSNPFKLFSLEEIVKEASKYSNDNSNSSECEFMSESTSFVSASSEILVSESDDHDDDSNHPNHDLIVELETTKKEIKDLLNETMVSDSDSASDSNHSLNMYDLLNHGLSKEDSSLNSTYSIEQINFVPIGRLNDSNFTPKSQSKGFISSSSDSDLNDSSD